MHTTWIALRILKKKKWEASSKFIQLHEFWLYYKDRKFTERKILLMSHILEMISLKIESVFP